MPTLILCIGPPFQWRLRESWFTYPLLTAEEELLVAEIKVAVEGRAILDVQLTRGIDVKACTGSLSTNDLYSRDSSSSNDVLGCRVDHQRDAPATAMVRGVRMDPKSRSHAASEFISTA
jgi:hypothetical protein